MRRRTFEGGVCICELRWNHGFDVVDANEDVPSLRSRNDDGRASRREYEQREKRQGREDGGYVVGVKTRCFKRRYMVRDERRNEDHRERSKGTMAEMKRKEERKRKIV